MMKRVRTWGDLLDAAARRDATERGEAHCNMVLFAMLAHVGRPKPLAKALPLRVVFLSKPKKKAPNLSEGRR